MPSYLAALKVRFTRNRKISHTPPSSTPSACTVTAFPGERYFRPEACNMYVGILRRMLMMRGAEPYYSAPLPTRWSISDLQACAAFQRAQGWSRDRSSGIPDSMTWQLLVDGQGNDIIMNVPYIQSGIKDLERHPSRGNLTPLTPPKFPGRDEFGPGRANIWILMLRLRLISQGWAEGQRLALEEDHDLESARIWDDTLRTSCTQFQVAHGYRGAQADGYPSEGMWNLLWKASSRKDA
ncbi:peptidoglycan-binding protein [Streptomyces violascens]|uniref:peptidoglycan-binding protein n=1 Tax=Streptomyces violascens TaxID=67381 RepID=UPI0036CBDA8F